MFLILIELLWLPSYLKTSSTAIAPHCAIEQMLSCHVSLKVPAHFIRLVISAFRPRHLVVGNLYKSTLRMSRGRGGLSSAEWHNVQSTQKHI